MIWSSKEEKEEYEERLNEIEQELRRMQKEWIDIYEKVIRLLHEK